MFVSYFIYLVGCLIYGTITFGTPYMKSVTYHMFGSMPFWICLIAIPALTMCIDLFFAFLQHRFRPEIKDKVMESVNRGVPYTTATPTSAAPIGATAPPERQETPLKEKITRDSSYAFDHPESAHKHHNQLRSLHPKAGDTSAIDKLMASAPETKSKRKSQISNEQSHLPPNTPLAQQKLPSFELVISTRLVMLGMASAGVLIILFGAVCMVSSKGASQLRIHYQGEFNSWPPGTKVEETIQKACAVGTVCNYEVTVPENMDAPIWGFYIWEEFYQNYNTYLDTVNDHFKDSEPLVSVANDSYSVSRGQEMFKLDINDIAWKSDLDQFNCNAGDPCTHDVVWTRASALPHLVKPRFKLDTSLKKDDVITVSIANRPPHGVESFDFSKELVLTTVNSFGGRHDALGMFFLVSGSSCIVLAVLIGLLHLSDARK
jgi:hypothetical protein